MTAYYNDNDPKMAAWLRELCGPNRTMTGNCNVLIAGKAVAGAVFRPRNQVQIAQDVVCLIAVAVVNVEPVGDGSASGSPDSAMQIRPVAVCLGVVSARPASVLPAAEHDKRKRRSSRAQFKAASLEPLVHGLARHAERFAYSCQRLALIVQRIHLRGRRHVWNAAHSAVSKLRCGIIPERLASVNLL